MEDSLKQRQAFFMIIWFASKILQKETDVS